MGKVAFVFAGQGAQYPGMGKELYAVSPAAKGMMDQAEALRPGTMNRCFYGTVEELAVTVHTQPCLFTVDLMCAAALAEKGFMPDVCAGFSLGEVAAAAFCNMLSFNKSFAFIQERARLMQACAEAAPGFMAAVLRLPKEQVTALCSQFEQVYPVNMNAPGQIVVSGSLMQRDAFLQAVAAKGGRTMPLKVGGAFHSPLMKDAAERLLDWLNAADIQPPSLPVYANSTAKPYKGHVAELLARQVDHPVLWEETICHMATAHVDTFVELGPGTVLSGLIKKILPEARTSHVEDAESLKQAIAMLEGRSA